MAISARAAGAWAEYTADGTVAIPAGATTGDRMFLFATWKAYTITATVSGWTPVGIEYADGTANAGNGTGSMKVQCWYKNHSGSESDPTLDFSASPDQGAAVIVVFQKASTEAWTTPAITNAAISLATNWSCTGASDPGIAAGDLLLGLAGFRDDSATMTRNATTGLDASGVSWASNVNEYPSAHATYTGGLDCSADLVYRIASSGTSSAAPTMTGTLSANETGAALFVRQGVGFNTETGSATADAVIFGERTGSATANAIAKASQAGSATADAFFLKTTNGSSTADATVLGSRSGSATANAAVLRSQLGSAPADGVILASSEGSSSTDATILAIQSGSADIDAALLASRTGASSADAVALRPQSGSATANAVILRLVDASWDLDAVLASASSGPVWVSPANGANIDAAPTLVFTSPDSEKDQHFHIQLDKVDTFDGPDLRENKTTYDATGWDYWDGDSWEPLPGTGLPAANAGADVRYAVSPALTSGTWYRRVRASL